MKKGEMSIQQMKSPSKSLQRLWLNDYIVDPYINLANAIVSIAADDFRTALEENNIDLQKSLEQFFLLQLVQHIDENRTGHHFGEN